jgi:iron-sulfur cluster assembly accessory protein
MVTMTDRAVRQLKSVMEKQGNDIALRVYVTPGGCSGFSYGMALDSDVADDDKTFDHHGVKLVVDPFSLQYLEGAQVDYSDALMGGGFNVQNPNAAKSCSCGQSFDTVAGGGVAKPCG